MFKSLVEKINKIPEEILNLLSIVKRSSLFINIPRSVNVTFDTVEEEAWKLRGIGGTLEDVKYHVDFVKQRYECISSNIRLLSCSTQDVKDLNMLKRSIEGLKRDMKILKGRISVELGYIEWNREKFSKSISEIKEYQKTLLKISEEIAFGFSKIGIDHFGMPLVITAHPAFGLGLHGSHGLWLPLISYPLFILSVQVGFIISHLSWIRMKLENIVRSGLIDCIVERVNKVDDDIKEVESSIESVIICFLKSSNKSIAENTKESTKRLLAGGGQIQLGTIEKLRFKLYQIIRKRNPELKRKGHINQRLSTNKALLRLKGKVDSVVYLSNLYNKKREKDSMERMKSQEPLVTFTEDES